MSVLETQLAQDLYIKGNYRGGSMYVLRRHSYCYCLELIHSSLLSFYERFLRITDEVKRIEFISKLIDKG
jgi:hypothetical protein